MVTATMPRKITITKFFGVEGGVFGDKDAELIGRVLLKLGADGKSTKEDVVEFARPESSPLHKYFEWDNEIAGEKYRDFQARDYIRRIFVEVRRTDGSIGRIRAFHAIDLVRRGITEDNAINQPDDKLSGGDMIRRRNPSKNFISVESIQDSPEYSQQVITKAYSQLWSWYDRWIVYREQLEGIESLFDIIKDFRERIGESNANR